MREIYGELLGDQESRSNAECFVIFQTVILKCVQNITGAQAIPRIIITRLNDWEAKKIDDGVGYIYHMQAVPLSLPLGVFRGAAVK